jgi:hypothetical protein
MRPRLLLLTLAVLAGCSKQRDDNAHMLREVKQRLSERDTQLTSYRLEGITRDEGAEPLGFGFSYRAPQKMLGVLRAPVSRAFSWDGEHLFEQNDKDQRFTIFKNELSTERRSGFLTETFAPFSPEGFRAPLLPSELEAKRASHPRAPEAVEVTGKVAPSPGESLQVTYILRWPTMDFLGRRFLLPDSTVSEVRVEEEHCDEALKLCVPQKLTRWVKGQKVGETTLSKVELNPALPNDTFTLVAPEGYEVQTKTLVNSEGK